MGEIKIELLPYAKPIKKRPYKLAHKYKDIVNKKIDNKLKYGILYLVNRSKWARPMVVLMWENSLVNEGEILDDEWILFFGLLNMYAS